MTTRRQARSALYGVVSASAHALSVADDVLRDVPCRCPPDDREVTCGSCMVRHHVANAREELRQALRWLNAGG